jgi:hypothetical protein
MRKLNYVSLIVIFLFWGCASGRMMNDADCLRKINTLIANGLDKNHVDYDLIILKVILSFIFHLPSWLDILINILSPHFLPQ